MKRHTQQPGIRQWAGEDLLELQAEPLKALDGFFEEYGPCIIKGLHVTSTTNGLFNISSGLVALSGTDVEGKNTFKVVPFAGVNNVSLPLYLTLTHSVVTRPYADGSVKPIAYDYRAVVATVKPETASYLKLDVDTTPHFVDVIQSKGHRFMTDAERIKLNGIAEGANKYVHPNSHPAGMVEFADEETLQQKYENGKLGGELPVQTILRSAPQAGNIFGEKWLPCDGRSLSSEDYPWVEIPLIYFQELNGALNLEETPSGWNYSIQYDGKVIVINAIELGGGICHLYYSIDFGKTFNNAKGFEGASSAIWLHYVNDRFIWVNHEGTIWYSLDGINWSKGVNSSNLGGGDFLYCTYISGYYIFGDYYSGNNLYSTDGINWLYCPGGSEASYLATGNNVVISGDTNSSGPFYNNGAPEWKIPPSFQSGYYYDYFVGYVKNHFWFINHNEDDYNGCWKSLDGINWTKLSDPIGLVDPYLNAWSFINNSSIILAMSPSTPRKKYKSIDGGLTFAEYTSDYFPNYVINDIFIYTYNSAWAQSVDGVNWKTKQFNFSPGWNTSINGAMFRIIDDNKLIYGKLGYNIPTIADHYIKVK